MYELLYLMVRPTIFGKARMRALLKSSDGRAWYFVINGWKALDVYSDGFENSKPMDQWIMMKLLQVNGTTKG